MIRWISIESARKLACAMRRMAAIATLFASALCTPAFAQSELSAAEITARLTEWDQGYVRLKRDIWNLERGATMFGRDFRGRTLNDDLRDFALTKAAEQHFLEKRELIAAQLSKNETRLAGATLLDLYRGLRDELVGVDRIGEMRMRHRQVAQQRAQWQQLATTVPNYRTPDNIRRLEQEAVEQLNAGRFEQTSRTTYRSLLAAYASERETLWKSGAKTSDGIYYSRRSSCSWAAAVTTGKATPALNAPTQPDYPAASKRVAEEGTVYLQLLVGGTGCVLQYAIRFSSGWPALDDAAMEWAETLQFVPAAKEGKPAEAWVTLPVVFRLED